MKIKGHTRIELTDVSSGNVENFDNDNMITNALPLFLRTYGWLNNSVLTNSSVYNNPLWQSLLGGVLLFDTAIDEDVNTITPPAGVHMVGNGTYGLANNSVVTELGSYNSQESGVQEDGSIKLVWDYTTSQANGTISSVCLTSATGGKCGWGNATSGNTLFSDNLTTAYQSIFIRRLVLDASDTLLYADYNEDAIYYIKPYTLKYNSSYSEKHWYNTGSITIVKAKAGFKNVGIKDSCTYTDDDIISEYTVAIPDTVKSFIGSRYTDNATCYVVTNGSNAYILFAKSTTTAGSMCYVLKIDKDFNTTLYPVTNNTSESLYIGYASLFTAVDSDDYLVAINSAQKKAYKIKLSDSTDVTEIANSNNSRMQYAYGKRIWANAGSSTIIYDTADNKAYKLNGCYTCVDGYAVATRAILGLPCAFISAYDSHIGINKFSNYLATINNLSEAVTKTSAKTMKVIYTLTFEEETTV